MTSKTKRQTYTSEYKAEALKLAKIKGVSAAAKELGLEDPLIIRASQRC
ncbi:hypothetical protein TUM17387_20030 [Shewanella carassii]|nr:hypothetical protein TUM17387_20030 [Shewanella carassii]